MYRFIGRRIRGNRYDLITERYPDGIVLLIVESNTNDKRVTFLPEQIDELLELIKSARGGD
jgi:hypothetical protein